MKRWNHIIAIMLVISLLLQMLPATIFATESEVAVESEAVLNTTPTEIIADTETPPAEISYEVEDLRTESTKHFRMSDGSFIAVQYATPVHYENSEGELEDIDNSLTLVTRGGSGQYRTENGDELRVFSQDLSSGDLFYVQSGETGVGMSLYTPMVTQPIIEGTGTLTDFIEEEVVLPYNTSAVAELNAEEMADSGSTGYDEAFYPDTFRSSVVYSDVYPGVDLQYEAYGYDVKESIIVNRLQHDYSFNFVLDLNGLTPQMAVDGSILLFDSNDTAVYRIPAPYMYDAAGQFSRLVDYSLSQESNGSYRLAVTADEEWIESATLPVVIDPTLEKISTAPGASIRSTYVIQGNPFSQHYTADYLFLGYGAVENEERKLDGLYESIIYAGDLPEVPEGSLITNASLLVRQSRFSSAFSSYLQVRAYQLSRDKNANETYDQYLARINWDVMYPDGFDVKPYPDDMLDFAKATANTVNSYLPLDITRAVKNWYDNDEENRCIYLCSDADSSKHVAITLQPYRSGISFFVSYRNDVGLEDYYTYQTQSAGRAGTGYVADHTLRLTLGNTLVSSSSEVMPFGLSLIYNSSQANRYFADNGVDIHSKAYTNMRIGAGWKLSAQETVVNVTLKDDDSGKDYYIYTDSDGTEHYFFLQETKEGGEEICDEDGLGLKLTKNGSHYTISDKKGNERYFRYGYLTHVKDSFGNAIYYCYNNTEYDSTHTNWMPKQDNKPNVLSYIFRVNNGAVPEKIVSLSYDNSNFLSAITNEAGQSTELSYATTNGIKYLTKITYPDTQTVEYTYSSGLLTKAYDNEAGYGIKYTYNGTMVSKISECNADAAAGTAMTCTLADNHTTYQHWGTDRTKNTEDDMFTEIIFDELGRSVGSYSRNKAGDVIGSSSVAYTQNSGTDARNNRISEAGSSGMTAINLLPDGSFEQDDSAWKNATTGTSNQVNAAVRDTANGAIPHTGNKSMKLYFNHDATATDVAGMYHTGIRLTQDKTYVISAYFKAEEELEWSDAAELQIRIQRGLMTPASIVVLDQKPNQEINDGWQRVYTTFTPSITATYKIGFFLNGCSGNNLAFVDDVQVEEAEMPSTYNLVQNGSFESDLTYWSSSNTRTGISNPYNSAAPFGTKAVCAPAYAEGSTRIYQTIPLNVSADTTFLLSGWAWAISAPSCNSVFLNGNRYFGLALRLDYSDGTMEYHSLPFTDVCRKSWQCAVKTIVPKKTGQGLTLTQAVVYCAYDNNYNSAYFDNISLRMEPVQTYKYDEDGNLEVAGQTGVNDSNAVYDGADLKEYIAPNGVKSEYTYAEGTHALLTANSDGVTTSYSYSAAGNAESVKQEYSTDGKFLLTISSPDTHMNHTVSVTDVNGQAANYEYDPMTEFLKSTTVAVPKGTSDETDITRTLVNEYVYDDAGRTSSVIQKVWAQDGGTAAPVAEDAVRVAYAYQNGLLSSMIRTGDVTSEVGSIEEGQAYNFTYSAWGQATSISVNKLQNAGADRILASYEYVNGYGNTSKMTYGNGNFVTYTYDTFDRLIRMEYNNKKYLAYTYNAEGSLAKITHGSGSNVIKSIEFEYDSLGRPIRTKELDGDNHIVQQVEHLYDLAGRLREQNWIVNGQDMSEKYVYSDPTTPGGAGDGSLKQLSLGIGNKLNYSYDSLKRLEKVSVTKPNSNTELFHTAYTYKDLGSNQSTMQIEKREVRKANGDVLSGYKYEYDSRGNIITVQEAVSAGTYRTLVTYTYDAKNQLRTETYYTYTENAEEPTEATIEYTYDEAGNILIVSDGVTEKHYHYDDPAWADLLTSISYEAVDDGGSETPDPEEPDPEEPDPEEPDPEEPDPEEPDPEEPDPEEPDPEEPDPEEPDPEEPDPEEPDPEEPDPEEPDPEEPDPEEPDPEEPDPEEPDPEEPDPEEPDPDEDGDGSGIGLRPVESGDNDDDSGGGFKPNPDLTFPTIVPIVPKPPIDTGAIQPRVFTEGTGTFTLSYDEVGNPESYYNGTVWTMTWVEGRRLETASTAGIELSFAYDADGIRTSKTVLLTGEPNTATHSYITESGKVVYEEIRTGSTVTDTMYFVYDGSGQPFALKHTSGKETNVYYYVLNVQGDVVGLIDANGSYVAQYIYDAWGNILASSGDLAELNPLRYRGYYYDTETGFYYLQSRYYDPVQRRFINADSFASTGIGFTGTNMFAYCNNAPVMHADSAGYALKPCTVVIYEGGRGDSPAEEPPEDFEQYDGEEYLNHNCYSYAFDLPMAANPGFFSYRPWRIGPQYDDQMEYGTCYSVRKIADFVIRDMKELNRQVRIISDPSEKTDGEYVVALKAGSYIFGKGFNDYHFAVLLSDGTWSDKPGRNIPRWNAIDGTAEAWPLTGVSNYYYDSVTIYFAVGT